MQFSCLVTPLSLLRIISARSRREGTDIYMAAYGTGHLGVIH